MVKKHLLVQAELISEMMGKAYTIKLNNHMANLLVWQRNLPPWRFLYHHNQ